METVYWRHHDSEDLVYRKTRLRQKKKFLAQIHNTNSARDVRLHFPQSASQTS